MELEQAHAQLIEDHKSKSVKQWNEIEELR